MKPKNIALSLLLLAATIAPAIADDDTKLPSLGAEKQEQKEMTTWKKVAIGVAIIAVGAYIARDRDNDGEGPISRVTSAGAD